MIGWYIHHIGRGHLHHALAVADRLCEPVTALSSLQRPPQWRGDWVNLARDDDSEIVDADAHGVLHWAPLHHRGLSERMAAVAGWLATERPRALVVDVSVEITTLARLFGVPVVTFCLPGVRTDAPHRLAWDLADAIIAPWPRRYPRLCVGLDRHLDKVCYTGGISRFAGRAWSRRRTDRHGVVLGGRGGSSLQAPELPGWTWSVLDGSNWCHDPWPQLSSAAVVITHAGLGAIADVAAARVPALVIPQQRPFGEQVATAAALAGDGLAAVADPGSPRWLELLETAIARGGAGWWRWSDGHAASRAAAAVNAVADRGTSRCAS